MLNRISIQDIILATGGTLIADGSESSFLLNVNTDTRKIMKGDLFVALKGESFDAHNFLDVAIEKGASTLIVQEDRGVTGVNVILVEDTLKALQDLASYWRSQLTDRSIGITGSNGKTSVKDLTAAVLSQKFQTKATLGNFNNHIGLPLTVLRNSPEDEATIYEMGMNHPGEIAPLCEICRPYVAVISSIGTAHIEYMKTQEAIAQEKGALPASLPEDGVLIITHDVAQKDILLGMNKGKLMQVGIEAEGVDVQASELRSDATGTTFTLTIGGESAVVNLPLKGRHMVSNALLAAAVGSVYQLDVATIAQGLSSVKLTSGRLRQFEHSGHLILDDTYNANPDSVKAAARTLKESLNSDQAGYLVLGAMGELGHLKDEGHREVGAYGANLDLSVISVGEEAQLIYEGAKAQGGFAKHFDKKQEAIDWMRDNLQEGSQILFKGSRSSAMETVMSSVFPEQG